MAGWEEISKTPVSYLFIVKDEVDSLPSLWYALLHPPALLGPRWFRAGLAGYFGGGLQVLSRCTAEGCSPSRGLPCQSAL